ncbi:MAG: hypothetical protein M1838_005044 [Thelocarpon superellum]|nr:MAG: hypothetical protein M1838_005044 [Thelocarpon superellum]
MKLLSSTATLTFGLVGSAVVYPALAHPAPNTVVDHGNKLARDSVPHVVKPTTYDYTVNGTTYHLPQNGTSCITRGMCRVYSCGAPGKDCLADFEMTRHNLPANQTYRPGDTHILRFGSGVTILGKESGLALFGEGFDSIPTFNITKQMAWDAITALRQEGCHTCGEVDITNANNQVIGHLKLDYTTHA